MGMLRTAISLLAVCVAIGAASSQAEVIDFQQGLNSYTGVVDTWLSDSAYALKALETTLQLNADFQDPDGPTGGWSADQRFKGAIRFDLGAIPAGSTITSATLMTYEDHHGGNAGDIPVAYRLLKGWVEGTKTYVTGHANDENWRIVDGAAQKFRTGIHVIASDIATVPLVGGKRQINIGAGLDIADMHYRTPFGGVWTCVNSADEVNGAGKYYYDSASGELYFLPPTSHTTMGVGYWLSNEKWEALGATGAGDIDLASRTQGAYDAGTQWASNDVTAIVQYMLDHPPENFGFGVGASGHVYWASANYADLAKSPLLHVEYQVPEPASLAIVLLGGSALLLRRRRA